MQKLILNNKPFFYFSSRFFTIKNMKYEIIATFVDKNGETIHTIRNLTTRETREIPHLSLIKWFHPPPATLNFEPATSNQ
ncbi:MAG: hypothetical protein U1C46_11605 [Bacteroidales bacterium]|nr:hypothetical protein [Bacteroidales bacterium]